MLKKFLHLFITLLLVTLISGCSIFMPHTQLITINGEPAGATAIVNGQIIKTPGSIRVRRNQFLSITINKDGYCPGYLNGGYSLSATGYLDIFGGFCFLFPFFGLISPGAFSLDQENFYYILQKR